MIKQKTEKTDDINQSVKSLESITGPVKAVVFHCRINIRTKDPKAASKSVVKSLKEILQDNLI